jgi:hypothetical protein
MAALDQLSLPLAHGGVTGAVIEGSIALLILAIGLAAWLGMRRDEE